MLIDKRKINSIQIRTGPIFLSLRKILFSLFFFGFSNAHADVSLATRAFLTSIGKEIRTYLNLMNHQFHACQPLNSNYSRYPVFIRNYEITKISERYHNLTFNIAYLPTQGVSQQEARDFRGKVISCFNKFKYFSDLNKETISLTLLPELQMKTSKIALTKIALSRGVHSHRDHYDIEADCQTIAHETFHLAGLWDEYKDVATDYSCRTTAKSIMGSSSEFNAFDGGFVYDRKIFPLIKNLRKSNAAKSEYLVESPKVECLKRNSESKTTEYMVAYKVGIDESSIESNRKIFDTISVVKSQNNYPVVPLDGFSGRVDASFALLHIFNKTEMSPGWDCTANITNLEKIRVKNLVNAMAPLKPAHLRKILYPNCIGKNRSYDLCTEDAYKAKSNQGLCNKEKYEVCGSSAYLN